MVAIERTGEFRGRYHVLGGAINPWEGVGPEQLRIRELMARLSGGTVKELILATDPNTEGEATATYLALLVKPMGLRVTRLASGLPVSGDRNTPTRSPWSRAFEGAARSRPGFRRQDTVRYQLIDQRFPGVTPAAKVHTVRRATEVILMRRPRWKAGIAAAAAAPGLSVVPKVAGVVITTAPTTTPL